MRVHHIATWVAWHGRLMVIGWVILLPLGILIARFFKVTPRQSWPHRLDNKFWWLSHLTLQYSGITVMTAAVVLAVSHTGLMWSALPLHAVLGWVLVGLGWLQLLGGVLRGSKGGPQRIGSSEPITISCGDHYNMTARRVVFEYAHKTGGYLALVLVPIVVVLGLHLTEAPRWMYAVIGASCIGWLLIFAWLQWSGRCIDTYQAIWGPSRAHPGNRVRPIGWGIRRFDNSMRPGEAIEESTRQKDNV